MKKTPGYITFYKEEMVLLKKVSPEALAVYFRLRERMNVKRGDFMSFPGQGQLLEEIGYSPKSIKSIKRLTKELESAGLIRTVRTRNPKSREWNSIQYYFKVLEDLNRAIGSSVPVVGGSHIPVGYGSHIPHNYKEVNKEKENQDQEPTPEKEHSVVEPVLPKAELTKLEDTLLWIKNEVHRERLVTLKNYITLLKDKKRLNYILGLIKVNPDDPFLNNEIFTLEIESGVK